MKMQYKNLLNMALGTAICLCLSVSAFAQKNNNSGGSSSSGGTRSSGTSSSGSSGASARPSGGSGFSAPRPSGGSTGTFRQPSGSFQRGGTAVRGPVFVDRQGNVMRGNQAYAPRVGVVQRGNPLNANINVGASARVGVLQRGGIAPGGAYRTVPQIGVHNSYWGNHGYYHYNRGYYNSYYLPRLGFSIGVLPYGYYPFYFGDYQYFYSDGLFYQFDNNQYTVVEPPIGAEVTTLPDKAQSIVINGQQYYELNGVYYQPYTKDDGTLVYEIAGKDGELNTNSVQNDQQQPQGPQMGDIVNQLPSDCRKIKVNGSTLYVSPDGIYYQQQTDANGNTAYKIVGLPSDEPDQGQN